MSDIPAIKKQLKIKAGSGKRLLKEHDMYRKELESQQGKVDKLIADGVSPDEWELKNAKRMLLENEIVLADSEVRLGKAMDDLSALVVEAKKITELAQDEDFLQAEEALGIVNI